MCREGNLARIVFFLVCAGGTGLLLPAGEAPFAVIKAPRAEGWTPVGRWKDEVIDGTPVCRLVAGTSYCRPRVVGKVPEKGYVMVRVTYYAENGPSFHIGTGSWGSPTKVVIPEGDGWRTEKLAFPAPPLKRFLKDGTLSMIIRKIGSRGPAISRIELYVPSREELLAAFKRYVKKATAEAFRTGREGGFTHVEDYDDDLPLNPSPEDEKRGVIPFLRSYLKFVYPRTVPAASERTTRGTVRMTSGEYEPFQFAVRALKDFSSLHAAAEGLPRGLEADVRWVECVPTRTKGGSRSKKWHVQPYRLWPSSIFPVRPLKAGETGAWWVIFHAAETLAAGKYPVKIVLKEGGNPVVAFTVRVEILPFRLPREIPRGFIICTSRMVEQDAYLEDLAEHGCNGLSAFSSGFKPVRGKEVDFSMWDAYFAKLKKYGLDKYFFWYLGNPRSGNAVLARIGREKFITLLKELDKRVADGRYPRYFALTIDEAVNSGRAFSDLKELSRLVRTHAPHLKVQGTSLDKHSKAVRYKGLIDVLACNGAFGPNSEWCRKNGIDFSIYSYVAARVGAAPVRLNYGIHPWRYGSMLANGWALNWNNGNAFNDLDGGASDWQIYLPCWMGKPISTPSWEGFREGVDDQRYLYLLEQLVKKGKADGALLEELRRRGLSGMEVWAEKRVGDSVFGAYLKNADALQIARERMIEEILKALKK